MYINLYNYRVLADTIIEEVEKKGRETIFVWNTSCEWRWNNVSTHVVTTALKALSRYTRGEYTTINKRP